jgi:metalloendopeptidase OMA1, mitochondrial
MSRQSLRSELQASILPQNHPLSRHVRRVVSRILHASNLGILEGEAHSPFGVRSNFEGDNWNPDADLGTTTDLGPSYSPGKEWDVIVVDDPKMINAMATPGRYTSNISLNNYLLLQSGIITVFTGILPICQDEDGLAAVLSHGTLIQRFFFL